MQSTWHVIAFYHHRMREALLSRYDYRKVETYTRAHDTYLREHDRSVLAFVTGKSE